MRLLGGRPLFLHAADTLRQVDGIRRVFVCTDNEAIASAARLHGYDVLLTDHRAKVGSTTVHSAESTIGDVVAYFRRSRTDDLAVVQPTAPYITSATITEAINYWRTLDSPSLITIYPTAHSYYQHGVPITARGRNRSEVDDDVVYQESGALRLYREDADPYDIDSFFIISAAEGREIDHPDDLVAFRPPRPIVFRLQAGGWRWGTGHLVRCLTLADELQHHDVRFWQLNESEYIRERILRAGYPIIDRLPSLPGLIVNDRLDTGLDDVMPFRQAGWRVLNIEDDGPGADHADAVVNDMLPGGPAHAYRGGRWAALAPDFVGLPPKFIRPRPHTVAVMFGGCDELGHGRHFASLIASRLKVHVRLLIGPLVTQVPNLDVPGLKVVHDSPIAEEMSRADLLVTSCGRSVFEASAVGVPTVTLAQNMREVGHSHYGHTIYLGLARTISDDSLVAAVGAVLKDARLRQELSDLGRAAVDGNGTRRVVHLIEGLLEEL